MKRIGAHAWRAALAAAMLGASAAGPAAAADDAWSIVSLLTEQNPPFNWRDAPSGPILGVGADMAREIFRRAGVGFSITLLPWARAYETARTQPGHCVFTTARIPPREALFAWIGPIGLGGMAIVARGDDPRPFATLEEMRAARIGVVMGDVSETFLRNLGGFGRAEAAPLHELNARKLAAGRIDLWASGRLMAEWQTRRLDLPATRIVREWPGTPQAIACHLSLPTQTQARLDAAAEMIWRDGTASRVRARYTGAIAPDPLRPDPTPAGTEVR